MDVGCMGQAHRKRKLYSSIGTAVDAEDVSDRGRIKGNNRLYS